MSRDSSPTPQAEAGPASNVAEALNSAYENNECGKFKHTCPVFIILTILYRFRDGKMDNGRESKTT
jgi:hypothetical protein